MSLTRVFFVGFSALLAASQAKAGRLEEENRLVRRYLGYTCEFQITASLSFLIGNNGHWSDVVRASTCKGERTFAIDYWPRTFFRDRPEYEIAELPPTWTPPPQS